jgi:hypothetical protein
MHKQYRSRMVIFLTLLFGAGLFFRLWFISLAPQPYGWDQYEYDQYTHKMLAKPLYLAPHTYRNYPYPLFLAGVYTVAGVENHQAVFFAQAVMDSVTGILIFFILRAVVKDPKAPWIGSFLYMFNPITSGYVGVVLSEVFTAFFLVLGLATGVVFVKKPNVLRGILFGLAVGIASEARSAALYWGAIPILLAFWLIRKYMRAGLVASCIAGVMLALLYPLWVNWQFYHEFNWATVDNAFPREFYQGALLKRLPPFTYNYPPESYIMWNEYHSEYHPQMGATERRAMAQKYMDKAWTLINRDRWDYIKVRFEKMWYVWQKENVFFYSEPGFAVHRIYTYTYNIVLLAFALFGFVIWPKGDRVNRWLRGAMVWSVLYATVAFSFTHAEYRLTVPFYPIIFAAAAVGLRKLALLMQHRRQ